MSPYIGTKTKQYPTQVNKQPGAQMLADAPIWALDFLSEQRESLSPATVARL
jgi:hypothetical protein